MSLYLWHNQINPDPCLDGACQAQISAYFKNLDLCNRMVLPAYALEFSPTNFLEQLFELLLTVGNREFYFEQFEICEYGELPSACPHELLVFQLVVRATEFPRGEWIHIFCNDRFQILGIRFELD